MIPLFQFVYSKITLQQYSNTCSNLQSDILSQTVQKQQTSNANSIEVVLFRNLN